MDPRLMAVGGNIIGGYLMGKAQREQRLEDAEIKQKQLKMLMDAQKLKDAKEERAAAAEERKVQILNSIFGPELTAQPQSGQPSESASGLKFGDTFGSESSSATQPQPKPRLVDILSDPLKSAVLKEMTGVDFLGAANAQRQNMQAMLDMAKYNREASQGTWVDMPDGTGGTAKIWQPKFGGPGNGAVGGYQPPKPDLRQFEQGGITYEQPFNAYTNRPVGGASVKTEKKPMPGDTAGKMGMLQSGLDAITQVQKMLMPNGEPDMQTYKVLAQMDANLPWTTGRQVGSLIDDAIEGKIRIESGAAVPDQEVKRMAKRFKPSVTDQPELIKQKLTRMETYLRGTIELLDPNKNYGKNVETFTAENGKKYVVQPNNKLDQSKAAEYLKRAGGDKDKARKIAKAEGWEF